MTFWLDEHLNADLAAWMGSRFKIIAKTLDEVGLGGQDDLVIFNAARSLRQIVLVSKDDDFVEISNRLGGPPQVIYLTCGNLTTLELKVLMDKEFDHVIRLLRAGSPLVTFPH